MVAATAGNADGDNGLTDPELLLHQLFGAASDGHHDLSQLECMQLLNGHAYVQYSRQHVAVNLSETRRLRIDSAARGSGGNNEKPSWENHYDVYIR